MLSNPLQRSEEKAAKIQSTKDRIAADKRKNVVKLPVLQGDRFGQAEFRTMFWEMTLPADMPYDAIFRPEFYKFCVARYGDRIKPGQRIEVRTDDQKFWAMVYVLTVNNHTGTMTVAELDKVELPQSLGPSNADIGGFASFSVGYLDGWKVRRINDGFVYPESFDSQHEAEVYIRQTLIGTRL